MPSATDALIVNIDHHHDNTRFGTINHVDPHASCTAEMVWDLMHGLGVQVTHRDRRGALRRPGHRHRPLHVREHRPARARDGGRADRRRASTPHAIYRHLYEGIPQGKLDLLARGLTNVERFDDGLLTVTQLTEDDYRPAGADESYSEGVVDHLRSVEGTAVAGLVRDQLGGRAGAQGLAARDRRPHRRLARSPARGGGGGHRRAAGFSTDLEFPELVQQFAAATQARRAAFPVMTDGVLLVDKPAGVTSHDVVAADPARGWRRASKVGHAGTLDPFATGLLLILVGRATRVQRFLMELPKRYETVARLGFTSTTGDPEGEIAPGTHAATSRSCCRRAASRSARRPTARSRSTASAPTRWPGRARRSRSPSAR